MIRLEGVGVRVPLLSGDVSHRDLLGDVELTLGERRIAIIGANGSGKSTLLRLLNGLLLPTTGRVLVHGLDTRTKGPEVRRLVGFTFTDPLSQLVMSTPIDDVALGLRQLEPDRRRRRERARAALAAHGLEQVAEQSVYDLSGGERQLVALAGVLAVEPVVLVCDEPTTLLDLRNRDRIREVLAGLPQQVIVATHDLDLAADAERVLVVDRARVVLDDAPQAAIAGYRALLS